MKTMKNPLMPFLTFASGVVIGATLTFVVFGVLPLNPGQATQVSERRPAIARPTSSPQAQTIPQIPSYWLEKSLPTVGMKFKSPMEGTHRELIKPLNVFEEQGSVLYFCQVNSKGVCEHTEPLMIGGLSTGFSEAPGRETGNHEVQGFHEEAGVYYIHQFGNTSVPLNVSPERVQKYTNPYGVEMLVIKNDDQNESMPSFGIGYGMDVIINTGDETYPGLYLNSKLYSPETTWQILSTIRFE